MNRCYLFILLLSFFMTGSTLQFNNPIIIAVIDSGLDRNRLDLHNNIIKPVNLINIDEYPNDETGHGTIVTSLIASKDPSFRIMPIKVTSKFKSTDIEMLAQAIITAVQSGADVINISLGSLATNSKLEDAVNTAKQEGVPIIASSGNDNFVDKLRFPAEYSDVIAVGAVDKNGKLVTNSNVGEKIDFVCLGKDIWVKGLNGRPATMVSGTSVAAPLVTLQVARILQQNTNISFENIIIKLKKEKSVEITGNNMNFFMITDEL
ncbi:S8 family serine peptidase [Bacillus sp. SM2101]|uniref:S8 family peptidase n=1 Tax=Bacillus sp. SM2101 TaxID=2805366 RepID=UPI001BDEA6AF|nr:S8 family serine peptidase [Bacillus sp. SM2101]